MNFFKKVSQVLGAIKVQYYFFDKKKLGYCGKGVVVEMPIKLDRPQNVFLYDNTNIFANATILTHTGKFVMKRNSGAAQGLTIVTGNHRSQVGMFIKDSMLQHDDAEEDVIVDEDVWIGANVTILAGVHVGRGAILGAGCLCRSKKIPPYAIVAGNPAKIVGFKFTPEEIVEHEKILYPEGERLPKEILEINYTKYYINRIDDIKKFLKQ